MFYYILLVLVVLVMASLRQINQYERGAGQAVTIWNW